MQPTVEQAEKQYQSCKRKWSKPKSIFDEMMGLYQYGAMGGDRRCSRKNMRQCLWLDDESRQIKP